MYQSRVHIGDAKNLGLIGAILILVSVAISFISIFASVLSLIGIILIFIAVFKISNILRDPRPKDYYLVYLILGIISTVVFLAGFILAIGSLIGASITFNPAEFIYGIGKAIAVLIIAFIISYIMLIIATYYMKKSYDLLKTYTEVDSFGTAGLLYFLGAILLIILIGAILILIGNIFEIIAWASCPEELRTGKEIVEKPPSREEIEPII